MKRSLSILSILLILVFVLSACGSNTSEKDTGSNSPNISEDSSNNNMGEADKGDQEEGAKLHYENIKLSPEEAFDIFKDAYPKAKVKEVELERKDNSYIYEIEGYDGNMEYELKIDSSNGNVLKFEQDDDNTTKEEIRKEDLSKVPSFVERALDDAGEGSTVKEWELKVKKDWIKFEVKVIDGNDKEIEYEYDFESEELIEKDM